MPHLTDRIVTIYWLGVWLALGFGVPEFAALITGNARWTLSDTAWRVLDVIPGQTITQWRFLHLLVSVMLFWLWLHISLRIWT